jgi:hypothetical protein
MRSNKETSPPKAYHPPSLTVYGKIGVVTGSGGASVKTDNPVTHTKSR